MLAWVCKHFNDLTSAELYTFMKLRSEVFVMEQNCIYLDADGKDEFCHHLMGYKGNELIAYARLIPKEVTFTDISIGRVATSPAYRSKGAGRELMDKAIEQCFRLFGKQNIQIGAQLYLKKFYESFGFVQEGEQYDEDGIPHIHMLRNGAK